MKEIIEELKLSRELCEIYTDSDYTDKFFVGYILESDQEFFVCKAINAYGEYDGWICCLHDNIIRVQTGTNYLKNLLVLYNEKKDRGQELCLNPDDLLLQMLEYIKDNKRICTIELCNSNMNDVIGFVSDISQRGAILRVKMVDADGKADGESRIDMNMVSCITTQSADERKLEFLFKLQSE